MVYLPSTRHCLLPPSFKPWGGSGGSSPSSPALCIHTNTLFSEEFFELGTWLKMTPQKSFCTFCGLEVRPTCQMQTLDWRRPDSSLNPKQFRKGIYPRVWGIVLIHYKEAESLIAILVSTSAFLCGPSVLVCSFFHLHFCFLEFEFWYLLV